MTPTPDGWESTPADDAFPETWLLADTVKTGELELTDDRVGVGLLFTCSGTPVPVFLELGAAELLLASLTQRVPPLARRLRAGLN